MAHIGEATESYEAWLCSHISVVREDLDRKHELMAEDAFTFLRATYYRWTALWRERCEPLAAAPQVLAVGDLHTENFGTWRDADGRLAWGINDFDEAYPLPYTSDLVRLATSALLAIKSDRLAIGPRAACNAMLAGYRAGLARGGRPFVLAERHRWLGDIARRELKDAKGFWKRIEEPDLAREGIPETVKKTLESTLPDPDLPYRVLPRTAGVGSLGCPRYLAVAHWRGGMIAREAKAMPPAIHAKRIAESAVGARDPLLRFAPGWRVRRLAPDCCKLDLGDLPGQRDEQRLLRAMGKETANVHCGSADSLPAVRQHLDGLDEDSLFTAARTMGKAVREEWKEWRALQKNRS